MGCATSSRLGAEQVDVKLDFDDGYLDTHRRRGFRGPGPLPLGWCEHGGSPWGNWYVHAQTRRKTWARPVLCSSKGEPQLDNFEVCPECTVLRKLTLEVRPPSDTKEVVLRHVDTEEEEGKETDFLLGVGPPSWANEPPPPDGHDNERFPLASGVGTRLLPPAGWDCHAPRVPVEGEEELLEVWAKLTFPSCWRELPAVPWSSELVELPSGFGLGSATLRVFILAQQAAEKERGRAWKRFSGWLAAYDATIDCICKGKGMIRDRWGKFDRYELRDADRRKAEGAARKEATEKCGPPPVEGWEAYLAHLAGLSIVKGAECCPPLWPPCPTFGDLRPLPFGGIGSGTAAREQSNTLDWRQAQADLGFPPFIGTVNVLELYTPHRPNRRRDSEDESDSDWEDTSESDWD